MRPTDQTPPGVTLLTTFSLVLFLAAVTVFAFDIFYWLKYASWSVMKFADVFRYYEIAEPYFIGWNGAREVWGYIRETPLSLLFLAIWFLFTGMVGSLFGSGMQNHRRGDGPRNGRWR